MAGAARQLASGGRLVTYGPYFETDQPAAPGNLAFDESLRARDPAWGIRQLDDVAAQAERHGLALQQRHAMPANNLRPPVRADCLPLPLGEGRGEGKRRWQSSSIGIERRSPHPPSPKGSGSKSAL